MPESQPVRTTTHPDLPGWVFTLRLDGWWSADHPEDGHAGLHLTPHEARMAVRALPRLTMPGDVRNIAGGY